MDLRNLDAAPLVHGRRAALRSAGIGLAAFGVLPLLGNGAEAKKRGKSKKRGTGKTPDRCLPQVAKCEAVAAEFCANLSNSEACRAALFPCCQPLGTCNGDLGMQCVLDVFNQKG